MKIEVFDTTLRDGMQSEDISFSVNDKLNIIHLLDSLGVGFIEVGSPASNIKDKELFQRLSNEKISAEIVCFGSTCRVGKIAKEDVGLQALLETGCNCCAIFGKAWSLHVEKVLNTTLEENLRIIRESIEFLKNKNKKVFFDAEHYFDGYADNKSYAKEVVKTAKNAGADVIVLCDTNGGTFPNEVVSTVNETINYLQMPIGVHFHNDIGMAVANTVQSVLNGVIHIQGTINGIGERSGNANLATLIANLQVKKDFSLIPEENMINLTSTATAVAQISNISTFGLPYIGRTAFSHKAGMHVDAVNKNPITFEHIDPKKVGNRRDVLISEMSGKGAVYTFIKKILPDIKKDSLQIDKVVKKIKELEYNGYQYESASASLELVVLKELGIFKPHFELERFRLITEQDGERNTSLSSAFVKVKVNDKTKISATESDGPVHALDEALRDALYVFFPQLSDVYLTDYKVRVLDTKSATGSTVRVFVETSDGRSSWTTVGVSVDVIEASKQALIDGIEYKLYKGDRL